ncbi:scarecrow-like protein 6 [Amborella trichopoda]|uniref:Uncharacterized protein n=1 Tax=Amborella trichopoda TaxID=13333 RepID=U5D5N8_AMBTC|nr:scarecrow-like protein 6 [Amborella trichopoda]ERN17520.1 hypothetical protein AMTR_s00059p00091580 [Amborella trichopoda]|eukprot:XP_006856053.1 scarecrow-like protein 6 [Amborella trichopoda]
MNPLLSIAQHHQAHPPHPACAPALEPTSVLDLRSSPTPAPPLWAQQQPPPMEEWDSLLLDEPSLMRWIMGGEIDETGNPSSLSRPQFASTEPAPVEPVYPIDPFSFPSIEPTATFSSLPFVAANNPHFDQFGFEREQVYSGHHHQSGGLVANDEWWLEQLVRVAQSLEGGNVAMAQAILARLNHTLPPSVGRPHQRALFQFKEALCGLLGPHAPAPMLPLDIVHKIGAYKAFSEAIPLTQFSNFTANQALLEAFEGAPAVWVIDLDMGLGGQWASLMQELAHRPGGPPAMRLTAIGELGFEMGLARENLRHFARELGLVFEFNIASGLEGLCASNGEAIGVMVGAGMPPSSPVARSVRRLGPRVVAVVEAENGRAEASLSRRLTRGIQYYTSLMESLEASAIGNVVERGIERLIMRPGIEASVVGAPRSTCGTSTASWREAMAGAGFSVAGLTNFTETQAQCLVERTQVRGFHVEKRGAALVLCWQRRPLVAASAWRCC